MASELKIGNASFFERRSPISWALVRGFPKTNALTRAARRPKAVVGALAAALATITPGPAYRKKAEWGRSTTTRRSPILRPRRGGRGAVIEWWFLCVCQSMERATGVKHSVAVGVRARELDGRLHA